MGAAVISARARQYADELSSSDPFRRAVAERQLARLRRSCPGPGAASRRSAWAHVPLAELFAEQGNYIYPGGDTRADTGHEPFHRSLSGRCVLLDPAAGRWWCRSCGRGGDAARFVTELRGCSHAEAAAWLAERFGPPNTKAGRWRPRRLFETVVA
jgi:hypothetical protein